MLLYGNLQLPCDVLGHFCPRRYHKEDKLVRAVVFACFKPHYVNSRFKPASEPSDKVVSYLEDYGTTLRRKYHHGGWGGEVEKSLTLGDEWLVWNGDVMYTFC